MVSLDRLLAAAAEVWVFLWPSISEGTADGQNNTFSVSSLLYAAHIGCRNTHGLLFYLACNHPEMIDGLEAVGVCQLGHRTAMLFVHTSRSSLNTTRVLTTETRFNQLNYTLE